MDLYERIMELGSMGYHCSQIIMIMTLETIGERYDSSEKHPDRSLFCRKF